MEIGGFDGCQVSDQWAEPGSHLPIKISELDQLQGAWTFKVPMPLGSDWTKEQYRVYYEMFLSKTADGQWGGGNVTVVFFWNLYSFNSPTGHANNLNGPQGMDVIDYMNTDSKGPFVDFPFPKGTYTPSADGTVTVSSVNVKAVLDYAVQTFPQYYSGDLYLSTLSLAEETGAFTGSVDTSYASFAIKKTGSDVVYTPPFTSGHWTTARRAPHRREEPAQREEPTQRVEPEQQAEPAQREAQRSVVRAAPKPPAERWLNRLVGPKRQLPLQAARCPRQRAGLARSQRFRAAQSLC